MAKIQFQQQRPALEVPEGSNLMKTLLEGGLPVASSCRGDGVCAKCRIEIVEGAQNLSAENATEAFLREKHLLGKTERISCQTQVMGDVKIRTSYW